MTQQEFFNRYTYSVKTDRIGGGGFGTVYCATDKVLHRKVAIKVSEVKIIGDKEFSLKSEFDAVGKLPPHQNIAHYEELYSFVSQQGVFDYAIMQFYEDGNLKNLIDKGKLTFEQKEMIATGILDGIAFLHKNKVVHRDLKPANILICREGDDYIPLITDFGLSKRVDEPSKSGFTNSIAGGSPGYMSPEQILGKQMQLNTDLWSYGVIVYELFTGERLFQSVSHTGSKSDVQDMILHKDISGEIASLPKKWREVAELCIERDNKKRVKSAGELYEIINGNIDGGGDEDTEPFAYSINASDPHYCKWTQQDEDSEPCAYVINEQETKISVDRSFSIFSLDGNNLICYVDGKIFLYDINRVNNGSDFFYNKCEPVFIGVENNIYIFTSRYVTPKSKTIVSYCESLVDYVSTIKFVNRIRHIYDVNIIRICSDLQLVGLNMLDIFSSAESAICVKYRDSAGGEMSECNMIVGDDGIVEIIDLDELNSNKYRHFILNDDSHLDLLMKGGAKYISMRAGIYNDRILLSAMTTDIVLTSSRKSEEVFHLKIVKGTNLPYKRWDIYKSTKNSDDYIKIKVGDFEGSLRFDKICKDYGPHMACHEDFSKFEYVDFYDSNNEESEFRITVDIDVNSFTSITIENMKTKRGYQVDLSEIIKESENDICNSEGYWYFPKCKFL